MSMKLFGLAQSDVAREAVDRRRAAEEGPADVEFLDLGLTGGDAETTADHQLEATRDGVALDHGDGGLL